MCTDSCLFLGYPVVARVNYRTTRALAAYTINPPNTRQNAQNIASSLAVTLVWRAIRLRVREEWY